MRKERKILRFVPQKLRKSFANGNPNGWFLIINVKTYLYYYLRQFLAKLGEIFMKEVVAHRTLVPNNQNNLSLAWNFFLISRSMLDYLLISRLI